MNVITATTKDLITPNSPRNRMLMSRQIRCVAELYKNFPDILVGGGMPYNAAFRVGARDIDIFCISVDTALALKEYLRGSEVSARLGYETKHHVFEEPSTGYDFRFNSDCLKFMGCPKEQRGVAFEFNVIVRRVPPETVFLTREQLVPLYQMTVPYAPYGICYVQTNMGLAVLRPKAPAWSVVYDTSKDISLFSKVQQKYLLLRLAFSKLGSYTEGLNGHIIMSEPNRAPMSLMPDRSQVQYLFNHTAFLIRCLNNRCKIVNPTSGLIKHDLEFQHNYWFPDELYFNEELSEQAKIAAFETIAVEVIPPKTMADIRGKFSSMSLLREYYFRYIPSRVGPRSQDWFTAWGSAPAVQPSGGEDTRVPEPVTESWGMQINRSFSETARNAHLFNQALQQAVGRREPTTPNPAASVPELTPAAFAPSAIRNAFTIRGSGESGITPTF